MMKFKLLFSVLMLLPFSVVASDDGQNQRIALDEIKGPNTPTHSEVPIDINVSNDRMLIFVNEEVESMSIGIYGSGASAVYDIDYAVPGDVYEYDISNCPCGHYYITVDADGETYSGNVNL